MEAVFEDRHRGMRMKNHDRLDEVMAMEARLKSLLKTPLTLIITDNTHSIISVKSNKQAYILRLHHMFLDAPEPVLASLAAYISGRLRGVRKRLRAFISENECKIRRRQRESRSPRKITITAQGRHFDLRDSFQRLNRKYFEGRTECAITWGNRRKRRRQTTVRLGSYSPETEIIRINRILDRPYVPKYVMDDIIHHEMLHHHLGIEKKNGRRFHHHETFKKMEKIFPHTGRAQRWIRKNLHRLLT
jgi:predicted SprT family Zn-dependent metalloprotease